MARTERRNLRQREELFETPDWLKQKQCPHKAKYMAGPRIQPRNITGKEKLPDLIDATFLAYNGARLREGVQLFTNRMLEPDVTVGLSVSGALTPAGLGCSSIIPLIKAGFVDWIVSRGRISTTTCISRSTSRSTPAARSLTTPTCETTTSCGSTTWSSRTATA